MLNALLCEEENKAATILIMVESTLACSYCHLLLESPVVMPCGESICKKHIVQVEEAACDSSDAAAFSNHMSKPMRKKRKLEQVLDDDMQKDVASAVLQSSTDSSAAMEAKKIYCCKCMSFHIVPEHGFAPNVLAEALLKKKLQKLEFSEEHKEAIKSCQDLDDLICIKFFIILFLRFL